MLIYFFYGIKTVNIKKYQKFNEIANYSESNRLIQIFNIINNNDIKSHFEQQEASPDLNDVYWTLYFATGDLKYIDKIVETIMTYHNETENKKYYLAARKGMLWISMYIQKFSQLRDYVVKNKYLSKDIKEYIVSNGPEVIYADTLY
jgi:hypothetical protein